MANEQSPPDSLFHHKERSANIRAEAKDEARKQAQAEAQREAQQAERAVLASKADEARVTSVIPEGATREHLLERIREMRKETHEVPREYYRSPGQLAQLEAEQAAGRAAVAKEEAEQERSREARQKAEAEQAKREGTMTPVHHANPSMEEQYPASAATLGKVKK